MRFTQSFFFSLLAVLLFSVPQSLLAQEVLLGDDAFPQVIRSSSASQEARTSGISSAPFPFFDDFSRLTDYPDTSLWQVDSADLTLPTISIQRAKKTPSLGVMTFDGATHAKKKHEDDLGTGINDVLISQAFDLTGFDPGDSLYLSFFYESGGWGDAPEVTDSMRVYFDTTGAGDYTKVWAMAGTGAAQDSFKLVMLSLDQTYYFNSAFRFKFETYGSLNGELDCWHLDYVLFDEQRSVNNTNFSDVSPTVMNTGILGTYTAVPRDFYQTGGFTSTPSLEVSNVSGPAKAGTIDLSLTDPVGGNSLTGSLSQNFTSGTLQPYANSIVNANAFADQAANLNQYGSLQLTAISSASGDTRASNDTLVTSYRVDTILAYDDGQPDAGYGLTYNRAFCQEYHLPHSDTISAVWIAFVPSLHFNPVTNQSTCMDGASFKLTLWDTLVPDSFFTSQGTGMVIRYDSAVNYFNRYTFINPQVVDSVFWIGIRQNDNKPLGIGFDKQGPSGKLFYEGTDGTFQASSLSGTIMIRPEFANIREEVVAVNSSQRQALKGIFYPNPVQQSELKLDLQGFQAKNGQLRIFDLQGRVIFEEPFSGNSSRLYFTLPEGIQNGCYLAEFRGMSVKGKQFQLRNRLLIQHP